MIIFALLLSSLSLVGMNQQITVPDNFKTAIDNKNFTELTRLANEATNNTHFTLQKSEAALDYAMREYQPTIDSRTRYYALSTIVTWGAAATSWIATYYACPEDTPEKYQEQWCFDGRLGTEAITLSLGAGFITAVGIGQHYVCNKRKIIKTLSALKKTKAAAASRV